MNKTAQDILRVAEDLLKLPEQVAERNREHHKLKADLDSLKVDVATAAIDKRLTLPRYHYELNPLDPDASWDRIIQEGQAIQHAYYTQGEEKWQSELGDSPSGRGWYGSVSMPVITIVATAPEYNFRSTKRLPGRFRLWSPARWGSALRFHCDNGPTFHDNWTTDSGIPYGFKTDAPIGIYVEPTVDVDSSFRVRPFEQSIENCLIVAHNGTLPIYLAQNQDRFWIRDCNIMNHQGAQVGIKHGPPVKTDVISQPEWGNCYLADPRFIDLQMEGPHNAMSPQAAIFASGNNIHIRGLNMYGYMQGVYLHGGANRYVQGQIHTSHTADGRKPFPSHLCLGALINQFKEGTEHAEIWGAPVHTYPRSATVATHTMGTHKAGEGLYGG
jgi:hypothetical protein